MYFTVEKAERYIQDLKAHIYEAERNLEVFKHWPEDVRGAHRPEFDDSQWQEFKVGSSWGGRDQRPTGLGQRLLSLRNGAKVRWLSTLLWARSGRRPQRCRVPGVHQRTAGTGPRCQPR